MVLQKLRHSEDASYESRQRERRTGKRTPCLPGTRVEILSKLELWMVDEDDYCVFWLNGMAGTGKSTIADSFARYARSEGLLAAAFFCSLDYETTRDINFIIPSLAYQMAYLHPQYRRHLLEFLKTRAYSPGDLEEQLTKLILEPMKSLKTSGSTSRPYVVIIDALDECNNDRIRPLPFITFLLGHVNDFRDADIKFFISSRPANEISSSFNDPSFTIPHHDRLNLHEEPLLNVTRDIRTFVTSRLKTIEREQRSQRRPFAFTQDQVEAIVGQAGGLFIFASTVCRIIERARNPQARLTSLSFPSANVGSQGLDGLYRRVFNDAFEGDEAEDDEEIRREKEDLRDVVGTILLLSQPLCLADLAILLGESHTAADIRHLLARMHSVIAVPDDDSTPVRAIHASFRDHITDKDRAHPDFYVDPAIHQPRVTKRCFVVMAGGLKTDNVCGILPNVDYNEVEDLKERCKKHISGAVEYACRHWMDHFVPALSSGQETAGLMNSLQQFAFELLLRWIDVLSCLRDLDRVVPSLDCVWQLLSVSSLSVVLHLRLT